MIPLQTLQSQLPSTPHLISSHKYKNYFAAACLNMVYVFDDFQFKFIVAVPSKPTVLGFFNNKLQIGTESGFYGEFSIDNQIFTLKKEMKSKITALSQNHIICQNILHIEDQELLLNSNIVKLLEFNDRILFFDNLGNIFILENEQLQLVASLNSFIDASCNSQYLSVLAENNKVLILDQELVVVKEYLAKQGVIFRNIEMNDIGDILYSADNEIYGIVE